MNMPVEGWMQCILISRKYLATNWTAWAERESFFNTVKKKLVYVTEIPPSVHSCDVTVISQFKLYVMNECNTD